MTIMPITNNTIQHKPSFGMNVTGGKGTKAGLEALTNTVVGAVEKAKFTASLNGKYTDSLGRDIANAGGKHAKDLYLRFIHIPGRDTVGLSVVHKSKGFLGLTTKETPMAHQSHPLRKSIIDGYDEIQENAQDAIARLKETLQNLFKETDESIKKFEANEKVKRHLKSISKN